MVKNCEYDITCNISFEIEHKKYQILRMIRGTITNSIPVHSHSPNSFEIHYILSGYGKLVIGTANYDLEPGMLYLTGAMLAHAQEPLMEKPMQEFCLYGNVLSQDRDRKIADKRNMQSAGGALSSFWIGKDTQHLEQLIEWAEEELLVQKMGYSTALQGIFQNMLLRLLRNEKATTSPKLEKEVQDKREKDVPSLTDQRFMLIENSFLFEYREITLECLAKRLGLSTRQTVRILQEFYQMSFQEKKSEARMNAAKDLLLHSDFTLSEIAEKTGFGSLEYFSSVFKKQTGISAREFRKGKEA